MRTVYFMPTNPGEEFTFTRGLNIEDINLLLSENQSPIWLIATDYDNESIIVTHDAEIAAHYAAYFIDGYKENVYIQAYDTYEDAYKSALEMREGHEFCYN